MYFVYGDDDADAVLCNSLQAYITIFKMIFKKTIFS